MDGTYNDISCCLTIDFSKETINIHNNFDHSILLTITAFQFTSSSYAHDKPNPKNKYLKLHSVQLHCLLPNTSNSNSKGGSTASTPGFLSSRKWLERKIEFIVEEKQLADRSLEALESFLLLTNLSITPKLAFCFISPQSIKSFRNLIEPYLIKLGLDMRCCELEETEIKSSLENEDIEISHCSQIKKEIDQWLKDGDDSLTDLIICCGEDQLVHQVKRNI